MTSSRNLGASKELEKKLGPKKRHSRSGEVYNLDYLSAPRGPQPQLWEMILEQSPASHLKHPPCLANLPLDFFSFILGTKNSSTLNVETSPQPSESRNRWAGGCLAVKSIQLLFQETWVQLPAPKKWLTTVYITSFGGSGALFWLPWVLHVHGGKRTGEIPTDIR